MRMVTATAIVIVTMTTMIKTRAYGTGLHIRWKRSGIRLLAMIKCDERDELLYFFFTVMMAFEADSDTMIGLAGPAFVIMEDTA
jgi:hypothetical protein